MLGIDLFLASNSPRRHELLAQIGVRFASLSVDIDESPTPHETADRLVERLALEKARAGLALRPAGRHEPVLGSDTLVVLNGVTLGKPRDREDAFRMWRALSGQTHQVMTAVALVGEQQEESILQTSAVTFRDITEKEMAAYWLSGEPCDKAGGYAVQGLGAVFIEHLAGSFSGVMGLPLYETAQLLRRFGIDITERMTEYE